MPFLSGIAGSLGGVGLGAAVVEVAVNTTALTAGLEKAKAEVAASTGAMSASSKAIGTGFIIAGAAAAIGMGKAVAATEELGTATLNLQRITGQSAESASSLLFVAGKLGVSATSLAQGFGLLEKNIGKGSTVLAKYGLDLKNADGSFKDFNTILQIAADKYVSLGDAQAGASFAQEVFGRGGKALIPILEQGSAGIAKLEEEAKRYGVVLSEDTVQKVLELAKAHRDLDASVQGLQVSIGTELVPVLTTFVHGLTDLVIFAQKVPGPVYVAVGSFVAATGALFLLQKAIALVGATWAPVTGAFGRAVVAEDALTVSTLATTTAIEAQTVAATGLLAKLGLLIRGGSTGIGGFVTPANVVLGPTSQQQSAEAKGLIDVANARDLSNETLAHSADLLHLNAAAVVRARTENISYTAALQEESTGLSNTLGPTGDLTSETDKLAAATQAAADAATAAKAAQDALAGGIVGLVGDMESVNAAQKDVNDLRKRGLLDTHRGTAAELALANATIGYNSDLKTTLGNIELAPGHFKDATAEVFKLGRQMGLTGGELRTFVDGALEALRAKADAAHSSVDGLARSMASLKDKKVNIDIITHYTHTGKLGP